MLGWKLFVRAITLILDNLLDALRVSIVPYLPVVVASVWVAVKYPDLVGVSGFDPENPPPGGFLGLQLLVMVANLVALPWIAVSWHRFVLLAEEPLGWVPTFRGPEILGYIGRSLLIGLLMGLAMVVTSIVVGVVVGALSAALVPLFVGSASLFVAMMFFYRLALVLPAGAIGNKMAIGESMTATKDHNGTVLVLALLTVGFSLLLSVPTLVEGGAGMITVIYELVVGWIGLILGVGTLTALYGYLIEGRPVD